ncbi:hypothetical protein BHE74_00054794, partial [Ensete ventricosum]
MAFSRASYFFSASTRSCISMHWVLSSRTTDSWWDSAAVDAAATIAYGCGWPAKKRLTMASTVGWPKEKTLLARENTTTPSSVPQRMVSLLAFLKSLFRRFEKHTCRPCALVRPWLSRDGVSAWLDGWIPCTPSRGLAAGVVELGSGGGTSGRVGRQLLKGGRCRSLYSGCCRSSVPGNLAALVAYHAIIYFHHARRPCELGDLNGVGADPTEHELGNLNGVGADLTEHELGNWNGARADPTEHELGNWNGARADSIEHELGNWNGVGADLTEHELGNWNGARADPTEHELGNWNGARADSIEHEL